MRARADIAAQLDQGRANVRPSSPPALTLPERRPAEWGIAIALFVLATAYSLLFRRYGLVANEGTILQGAQRILDGQVPYRDFFTLFTPGSYYFHALLFRIFGDSIIVARTAEAVNGGLFAALTYLLARRVCARWSALLTAYIVVVTVLSYGLFAVHNWDSTVWAYLTLYCAIWLLQRPHWGWALGMGTCCSLTALFEQSKGAGLLLGLTLGFAVLAVSGQVHLKRSWFFAVVTGLAWPVAITTSYFGAQHALPQMMKDLIHPLQHYAAVNEVPYGYMNWGDNVRSAILDGSLPQTAFMLYVTSPPFLVSALPIIGAGVLVYSTIQTWKMRPAWAERWSYYVLVSACTSGLLLCVLGTRKDWSHLIFIAPIVSLILSWLLDGSDIRLKLVDPAKPVLVFVVVVAFFFLGFAQLLKARGSVPRATRRGVLRVRPPENALGYLQAHLKPGEEIFVYPYFPPYYYLTATSNPTPYDFLQPGYNTPEEFQQVLNVITVHRPRVVLFQPRFYEDVVLTAPSMPLEVLGARDPVTEYILREYRSCAVLNPVNFGGLAFMVRKDLPCPQAPAGGAEPKNGDPKVKAPPWNSVEPGEPSQDAR